MMGSLVTKSCTSIWKRDALFSYSICYCRPLATVPRTQRWIQPTMRNFALFLICSAAATACDPSTFLHNVGTHASKYYIAPAATSASSCCFA